MEASSRATSATSTSESTLQKVQWMASRALLPFAGYLAR